MKPNLINRGILVKDPEYKNTFANPVRFGPCCCGPPIEAFAYDLVQN
jgi:hypothetical protein